MFRDGLNCVYVRDLPGETARQSILLLRFNLPAISKLLEGLNGPWSFLQPVDFIQLKPFRAFHLLARPVCLCNSYAAT